MRISPEVGESSPAIRPSRVDLPLPEGPTIETNWPSGMTRSSDLTMVRTSAPEGTFFETLYNSIMKVFLLSLIFIVIPGFAACGSKERPAPAEATPPAPPRASTASSKSVAKIVAFGDSLTAGYGLSTSESYPALLQKKLEADGFNYEVVNAGVSGDTSAGGLRRIDWALDGDVKFVILELGANDILRGQPV